MKIITGSAKGRRLLTLEGSATRPTSERIKEAIFSSIQFDIEGRRVLDLFAGCGQLGLEALSRGADSATFVDSAREAMELVKANARSTGLFERGRYAVSDYRNWIRKEERLARERYDLVFLDPPYGLSCATDALQRLQVAGLLRPGAIAVLETGEEPIDLSLLPAFQVLKATQYGKKTAVHILLLTDATEEAAL